MRIVILTGNAIRHKFIANTLAKNADDSLVVSECTDSISEKGDKFKTHTTKIEEHFLLRQQTEKVFFNKNDFFISKTLPILYKEVNLPNIYGIIKDFSPEAIFSFGPSIIKYHLLTILPPGHFINLHLGLSPYYRGSGTNFWPFVNEELEFVGATIMHINAGIDTGDIIVHVTPQIEVGDNVHTVGCKVISESAMRLIEIMGMLRNGKVLKRVKQWEIPDVRYYKDSDFNEDALNRYKKNLDSGLIEKFIKNPKKPIVLVTNENL